MKKIPIILTVCAVLGIACLVVYKQTANQYETKLTKALEQERDEYWDRIGMLEKNVAELEEELAQQKDTIVPKEKLEEVYGEEAVVPSFKDEPIDCEAIERQISAVFSYLDNKEYVQVHNLPGGTYELFQTVVGMLSQQLPLVSGEMKDMVSLTRNIAHFFRVMGENRIDLFKEIMGNEDGVMETMMGTLFSWFLACDRCGEVKIACPPLDVLYQYGGFFLNTLAGKSYLLRRDSKVRVLVSYYCVLILDRANDETLNRHGIDIRHFIYYLFQDISNQKGLIHKKAYLDRLNRLRIKYQTDHVPTP
jgi:hypothetical protein